jgi:hypothetical protein
LNTLRGKLVRLSLDIGNPATRSRILSAAFDSRGQLVEYVETLTAFAESHVTIESVIASLNSDGAVRGVHRTNSKELSTAKTNVSLTPLSKTELEAVRQVAPLVKEFCGAI